LPALALATLVFGLGHAYQGARAVLKVTLVGSVLAALAWLAEGLWAVILLHVFVDVQGGEVGYKAR